MSATRPASRSRLLQAARDRSVWRRALLLGLPVGLLQAALNQGDHWLHHAVDSTVVLKTILSPLLSCTTAFLSVAVTRAAQPSDSSSL